LTRHIGAGDRRYGITKAIRTQDRMGYMLRRSHGSDHHKRSMEVTFLWVIPRSVILW
jgi:hypothetical protein